MKIRFTLEYIEHPKNLRKHHLRVMMEDQGYKVPLVHDTLYNYLPIDLFFQVEDLIEHVNELCQNDLKTREQISKISMPLKSWKFSRKNISWGFVNRTDALLIKLKTTT
jgi:hypothetical protein